MDRQVDGQIGRWIDRQMDIGQIDIQIDRWIDRQVDRQVDGQIGKWIDRYKDRQVDRQIGNGQIVREMGIRIDSQMNIQLDG